MAKTSAEIMQMLVDNNVKFVRFAFCDIFGTQKNIAVLANDLPKALSLSMVLPSPDGRALRPATCC